MLLLLLKEVLITNPCLDKMTVLLTLLLSMPGARPGFTASMPMTTADMLTILTTAPLEYSYFDHGKLGAWAGPKHWKFKALAR